MLRIAAFGAGLLLLTSPLWRPQADETKDVSSIPGPQPSEIGESRSFRYAGEKVLFVNREEEEKRIKRQLYRHARHMRDGFYRRVVDNPEMPVEVRERFAVERNRLEKLAADHPELVASMQQAMPARQLNETGEYTKEFEEFIHHMKTYGAWERMVDDHVKRLMQDLNNPDIPEEERPSLEQIDRVRQQQLVPGI